MLSRAGLSLRKNKRQRTGETVRARNKAPARAKA